MHMLVRHTDTPKPHPRLEFESTSFRCMRVPDSLVGLELSNAAKPSGKTFALLKEANSGAACLMSACACCIPIHYPAAPFAHAAPKQAETNSILMVIQCCRLAQAVWHAH